MNEKQAQTPCQMMLMQSIAELLARQERDPVKETLAANGALDAMKEFDAKRCRGFIVMAVMDPSSEHRVEEGKDDNAIGVELSMALGGSAAMIKLLAEGAKMLVRENQVMSHFGDHDARLMEALLNALDGHEPR